MALDEDLVEGEWFIPGHPDQALTGVLDLRNRPEPILRLVGRQSARSLSKFRTNPDVVLGDTSTGQRVTLLHCYPRGGNLGRAGVESLRLGVSEAVFGRHFDSSSAFSLDALLVSYDLLDEWAGEAGFGTDPNDFFETRQLTYAIPKSVPLCDTGQTAIALTYELRVQSGFSPYPLQHRTFLGINPAVTTSFYDLLPLARRLRTFLMLATCSPIGFGTTRGLTRHETDAGVRWSAPFDIRSFSLKPSKEAPRKDPSTFLFRLPDVSGEISAILARWLTHESLAPVYNLYAFAAHSELVVEERFQSIVTALEAFHRRVHGGTDLPEEQHAARIQAIVSAVPSEHRHWLEGKLTYSNEISLRARLKSLAAENWASLDGLLEIDRTELINQSVEARNLLAHYSKESEERVPSVEALPSLTRALILLLEAALLREMGLSPERIRELMERNKMMNPYRFLRTRNIEFHS